MIALPLLALALAANTQTFHGYVCTKDCSGYETGWRWGETHGIIDPDDCGGNSQSFIEGCEAYAEELLEDADLQDDCDDDGYNCG